MSFERNLVKSLEKSAAKTCHLRDNLSKKLSDHFQQDQLFDFRKIFKEWIQATPFLNYIQHKDHLNGNYFTRYLVTTTHNADQKTALLQDNLNNHSRIAAISALQEHVNAKVAATFYDRYAKSFTEEDSAFWHKLIYRLINREYIRQGSPEKCDELMVDLAKAANDHSLSSDAFRMTLHNFLSKFDASHCKVELNELQKLKETWEESAFLAHLSNEDFIKSYKIFLEEKKIFDEMKVATFTLDADIKVYLEQYSLFMQQAQEVFVLAMNQRARMKILCKGNHYVMNPLLYVYDQLSSGKFSFDEIMFPMVTYSGDDRHIPLFYVDNREQQARLFEQFQNSSDLYYYCYEKSTHAFCKFIRNPVVKQLPIKLKAEGIDRLNQLEKEKHVTPEHFLMLQKEFANDADLDSKDLAARTAVSITISYSDSLNDEQFNYYKCCIEKYITSESSRLLNIQEFFRNDAASLIKFRKYAAIAKKEANEVFDNETLLYPFEFVYKVLQHHEKAFRKNTRYEFLAKFRLKRLLEKNKLITNINIFNANAKVRSWLKRNINAYLLLDELDNLIRQADISVSYELLEKIRAALNRLSGDYIQKNNNKEALSFLIQQKNFLEEKYFHLKEIQFKHDIDALMQQLISVYYQEEQESFSKLLMLIHAAINRYDGSIQDKKEMHNNTSGWSIALKAAIKAYQQHCLNNGSQIQDITPLFQLFEKMKASSYVLHEKIERIEYHLHKQVPLCLHDDGTIIREIMEANTSINYKLHKSILSQQTLIAKHTHAETKSFIPDNLKIWLTGNDLDKRIEFVEKKKSIFEVLDEGLKAADSLSENAFVGFSNDCFYEAIASIRLALHCLDEEKNENIEMNFFDKFFFHTKTWEIKKAWKNEANKYEAQLKTQYNNIMARVKKTFLDDLKRGVFNNRLYKVYQEAVDAKLSIADSAIEESIREAVLLFPFVVTKAGDIDHHQALDTYLHAMLRYVDNKFSDSERSEYYHLLLDKSIQGILEHSSLIGDEQTSDYFNLSSIKTQRQLKFEQLRTILNVLEEAMHSQHIVLDLVGSPLLHSLIAFVHDEANRMTESSRNEALKLLGRVLSLDSDHFQHEIMKINATILMRTRNEIVIENARECASVALVAPKGLLTKISTILVQFNSEQQLLFKSVFKQVISPFLKYLLDMSYTAALTKNLHYDQHAPKEQLLAILENDLIIDQSLKTEIYSQLFKLITAKKQLDFYDKRILSKIAQLKMSVKELSSTVNDIIRLIETSTETERALYLDIIIHSPLEIKNTLLVDVEKDSLSPGKKAVFLYHINRLQPDTFNDHYLNANMPYNNKMANLIEESYQETFKENYRFKEFLMILEENTANSKEYFATKLENLHASHVTLKDYIGGDNCAKLVSILYEKCKGYEVSLQVAYLQNTKLPQPIGVDKIVLFNCYMAELANIVVEKEECQFIEVIQRIQENLPLFVIVMPLLKALHASFQHPRSMMKAFEQLQQYSNGILKSSSQNVLLPVSDSVLTAFLANLKKLFPQTQAITSEAIELNVIANNKEMIDVDFSILKRNDRILQDAYYRYFQRNGLTLLEEKIDQADRGLLSDGFLLVFALKKNHILDVMFKQSYSISTKQESLDYESQCERVRNKIELLLSAQFNAIVSIEKIDKGFAANIAEWLQFQFHFLEEQLGANHNDSFALNDCYRLITFYLRNKNVFTSHITGSIDGVIEKFVLKTREQIIPALQPNSPGFLIDQSVEDKNGMAVKYNRERYYKTLSLCAMIYQLVNPNAMEIKNGLRLLKSAYVARGVSQGNDILRFDKINPCRTESYYFRYNAFEAFVKEPLNTLFFEEELSPLISFLGSYRTSTVACQIEKWNEKVFALYANETLLNRLIANWYAFNYECSLYARKNNMETTGSTVYDQSAKDILSLFNKDYKIAMDVLRNQFTTSLDILDVHDDFFSVNDPESVALMLSYKRLINISKIVFSITPDSDIGLQKQSYIIRLLKISYELTDRDCYINLALAELKAIIASSLASAFFDLRYLSKDDEEFIKLFYADSKLDQSNQLPFSHLIEVIEKKMLNQQHNQKVSQEDTELLFSVKQFKSQLITYFSAHLKDKYDQMALSNHFESAIVDYSKFSDINVQKKYRISKEMLSRINFIVIHYDFSEITHANKIRLINQAIHYATLALDADHIASKKFRAILDQFSKCLQPIADYSPHYEASMGWR